MKRRYLNGRPVFEPGESVEAFDASRKKWIPAVVEKRYIKAETSGRRSYEYGVRLDTIPTSWMLADGAEFIRVPGEKRFSSFVQRAKVQR